MANNVNENEKVSIEDIPDYTLLTEATMPCACFRPRYPFPNIATRYVGQDKTKGRYGNVSVQTCSLCQRRWLEYGVEYAGFSESGRYFRGVITPEIAASVTPEAAADILGGLEWHLYGGCYFRGGPFKGSGPVHVDL